MALIKVFMLMNVVQIFYTALLTLVKDMFSNRGVGIFEFAFFRSLICMIPSAVLVKVTYKESFFTSVPRNLRPTLLLRTISGTLGFLFYTTAPKFMPLGILTVIYNLSLFTTAILAWSWLHEKIVPFEAVAMFITMGGVILLGAS